MLGCTGSGKGNVARTLAGILHAEIVSVDSMKVYRRMDIGTATPPPASRADIPHHLIDVVEPSDEFSVARFVELAERAIADVHSRNKITLAVGGTALYIKSLSEGLFEGPGADEALRNTLKRRAAEEGTESLHAELAEVDPEAADRIHRNDERRIVRALEVYHLTGKPISSHQAQWSAGRRSDFDMTFVGLRHERDAQNRRINARVRKMMDMGLVDEVLSLLAESKPLSTQAAQAVGYAEMIRHLRGEWELDYAVEQIKINTRRLAKHQRTWFRRFADVHWIDLDEQFDPAAVAKTIATCI